MLFEVILHQNYLNANLRTNAVNYPQAKLLVKVFWIWKKIVFASFCNFKENIIAQLKQLISSNF